MAESHWTVEQFGTVAGGLTDLQNRLQQWEVDHGLKIGDLLLTIETQDRPVVHLGLVSFADKSDTTLQFEVLDTVPDLTLV